MTPPAAAWATSLSTVALLPGYEAVLWLVASLACSAMAVRYHNHAGFIASIPVGADERERWTDTAPSYLRRGGLLYGWDLRYLVMVAPAVAAILYPMAAPAAAVAVIIVVLAGFDRFAPS